MRAVEILGVPVALADAQQTIERIRAAAQRGGVRVSYVNAHTLNLACRDPDLREALRRSDFVLNDGIGLSLAALMQGVAFPENLNGSDFNLRILQLAATADWPVFLLGGRPGVAERAGAQLARAVPGLRIVGTRHGFHERPDLDVEAVRSSGAQVLLVAMGNPRQELWLARSFAALDGLRIGVGVGAFLDFQARVIPRAPRWMNKCGVEWVYRLMHEPRRLSRRYLVGNPLFLSRVMRERLGLPALRGGQ